MNKISSNTEKDLIIENVFIEEDGDYKSCTHADFYNITKATYTTKLLFDEFRNVNEDVKRDVQRSLNNSQVFNYEMWLGFLLKNSKSRYEVPYRLCITEHASVKTLEDIQAGSVICFVYGSVQYRPLFCWKRDKHFLYSIGMNLKKYIINMSRKSNIAFLIETSKYNPNLTAVPILIDNIRYIVYIAKQNIVASDILYLEE